MVFICTITNVFNMYFLYFLTHRFNFDIAYSIFNTVINIKVNMLKIIVNKPYYYYYLPATNGGYIKNSLKYCMKKKIT